MDNKDRVNQILMEEDSDDDIPVPPPENRMTSLFSGLEMRGSDEEDDLLKTHQPLARNKFNLTKPDSDDEITPIPEGEEEKDILDPKEDLKDLDKAESDPEPGNHKENNLSSDSEEAITTVKPNLDRESSNSEANSEEEGQPTDRMSLYDAIMEKTNNNNKDLVKNIINSVDSDEEELDFEITEEEK